MTKILKQPENLKPHEPSWNVNGKFWDFFIANRDKRFIVEVGGAGSGKSYTTAQWFVYLFNTVRNKIFLVARKTLPSLRVTAMQLLIDLFDEYGLPYHLHDSPPIVITNGFGNKMYLSGLDDPEKMKSFEPDFTWWEEASQFHNKDFGELNRRVRGISDIQKQMYFTLNPVDKLNSWVYKEFWERERKNAAILLSTWKDNYQNLDQEYIDELKSLEQQDKTSYDIYNLGLWGVLKNTIYTNWEMVDAFPKKLGDVFWGLDFGWNHPMAIIEIRYVDGVIYEKEHLYQSNLTTPELIAIMKTTITNKNDCIYADSSEPDRIAEIRLAGFNIYPAKKDVEVGIDFVKRFKTHIVRPSANLENEKRSYHYQEDPKTGEIREIPVKWKDDLMDAERYAIFTHLFRLLRPRVGKKTITKEILGVP